MLKTEQFSAQLQADGGEVSSLHIAVATAESVATIQLGKRKVHVENLCRLPLNPVANDGPSLKGAVDLLLVTYSIYLSIKYGQYFKITVVTAGSAWSEIYKISDETVQGFISWMQNLDVPEKRTDD